MMEWCSGFHGQGHLSLPEAQEASQGFLEKTMLMLKGWKSISHLRACGMGKLAKDVLGTQISAAGQTRQVLPNLLVLTENLGWSCWPGEDRWGESTCTHHRSGVWGWEEERRTLTYMLPASCGSVTSPSSQVSSKRCTPLEQLGCQGQPWKAASLQRQSLKPLAPGPHKPGSDRQQVGGSSQPDPSVRLQDRANILR